MTGIISAISGHFSKSLLLGTFLPSLLFVVLGLILVPPLLPANWQPWEQLQSVDTQGVVSVSFVTVVLTGLLYNLNPPIIRFYEGYTWKGSLLARLRMSHYRRLAAAAAGLEPRLADAHLAIDADLRRAEAGLEQAGSAAAREQARREVERLRKDKEKLDEGGRNAARCMTREYPKVESVLPTKLGNVIRSYENYPGHQYSLSAIELWPRLVAKVDKEYAAKIDDVKSSFDFMVNCSVLAAALGLLLLFIGLWYPVRLAEWGMALPWLGQILLCFAFSYAFYLSAIGRASEWGDLVKGAFDLYRRALLRQLGFQAEPATLEEERRLWHYVSQQIIYGDARAGPALPPFAESPVSAQWRPPSLKLEVTRGLRPTEAEGVFAVTVRVRNRDPFERAASGVVVFDKLRPGFDFVWDSARLRRLTAAAPGGNGDADASGLAEGRDALIDTSPLSFHLGEVGHGATVILHYQIYRHPLGELYPAERTTQHSNSRPAEVKHGK